jgi:hypothetical protein
MALTFVNGKPKKKVEVPHPPASLEEAMTPVPGMVDSPALNAQLKAHEHIGGTLDVQTMATTGVVQEVEPAPFDPHTYDAKAAQADTQKALAAYTVVTEEANSEVLATVDRYTELQEQIDAADVSHLLKEQEGLKKSLQSIAKSDQFPSNKKVQLHGTHDNYVEFSEQANSTKIVDKAGLIAAIGIDKYIELTDITLANAKKVLSEGELEKFTTIVPGARTLKGVHKGN